MHHSGNTTITRRIAALQLLFTVLFSAAVGAVSYALMSQMLEKAQHDRITDNVYAASSIVHNFINSNVNLLQRFSDEQIFEKYLHSNNMAVLLKHFENFYQYFDSISYAEPEGKETFKHNQSVEERELLDLSATPLFRQSAASPNTVHLADAASYIPPGQAPDVRLGLYMITYFGEHLGFISVNMPRNQLDNSLQEVTQRDNIRTLVTDSKGYILYDSVRKWQGRQLPEKFSDKPRTLFCSTHPQTIRTKVFNLEDCIITGCAVHGYDWQVFNLIEYANYSGPLRQFRLKLTGIITLVSLLVAIISMLYMQRILKPVKMLTQTARRIASSGNPDHSVEWKSGDDLGDLAHSFNSMLERLRLAQNELLDEKNKTENIISSIADPVIVTDKYNVIVKINHALTSLLGLQEQDICGRNMLDLFAEEPDRLSQALIKGDFPGSELQSVGSVIIDRDMQRVFVSVSGALLKDTAGEVFGKVFVAKDITKLKQAHMRLNHIACHDKLTGLPNRIHLTEQLDQLLERIDRHDRLVAVLFIDLDRFKFVNDTLGHSAGDKLLKTVAERLQKNLRNDDLVVRFGGDEFVVVLNDIASLEDVSQIAGKLLTSFTSPINLDGHAYTATASIGISMAPDQGQDTETLLKYADLAMYNAKEKGRNNFQIYSTDMHFDTRSIFHLEVAMRQALENDEYAVFFQPVVDTCTRRIVGVEALVRWVRKDGSLCSPVDFIPIAEETGLILPLGRWILEYSLATVKKWHDLGHTFINLSVNISERQFRDPKIVDMLQNLLSRTQFPAERLNLELTESILMQDTNRANQTLDALKGLGLKVSVDDFGTGYSSLAYLKRFSLDILKIDRSFVKGLPDNKHDAALTKAIIGLAHTLDLKVVAEGVELEAQAEFLQHYGAEMCQGYLFSKPRSASEIESILSSTASTPYC